MPTTARNEADQIARLRREDSELGERFVDLRLDIEMNGESLLTVGGLWDRRRNDYSGAARSRAVVRIHPGQVRAVRWFKSWLAAHAERRASPPPVTSEEIDAIDVDTHPDHVYAALFAGGRRGGKTWMAVACAVVYAVRYPGAIIWIVSANDQKHDEVRRYLAGHIADEWLQRVTLLDYDLCNGSRILLKSAHNPDLLKEGKANLVILNEGQMMSERAFVIARGAIVDQSGAVLVCANPPVEAKDHQWVTDFAAEASAGRRAAAYLEFNALMNPHIDRHALIAMKAELDERTFAIEVLGQFRGPKDAVCYNWVRLENEIPVPAGYRDVTEQFLELAGEGLGITHIVGLDVQRFPYIGGPHYKLFVPPNTIPTAETVLAWIVGETVLDGGDEVDFCHELVQAGLGFETTLIVCDATAEYQHSRRREADEPPPEWHGRGSFSIIRSEGFRRIVPPDRRLRRKNPPIVDRMRAFTSMICSGVGVRRLFADPVKAPRCCKYIRDWRTKHGTPSRTSEAAHVGDGASYPIIRLFPRRLRAYGQAPQQQTMVADTSRGDRPLLSTVAEHLGVPPPAFGPPPGPSSRRAARTRGL
jgi:hypothetical protein